MRQTLSPFTLVCLILLGCAAPDPRPELAIVVEGLISAPHDRAFEALKLTLADKGASVLFGHSENGVLAFEWPSAPDRSARARTVVRLSPAPGGTSIHLRTAGYLPSSDPPEVSFGLEVGRAWIGRTDDSLEAELVQAIEVRSQGP
jgi:hypothetical protein